MLNCLFDWTCFLSQMADQEQQLPKQPPHQQQQQDDQPLDLQQQVLQIQELRRQRLNDDTVRLFDNLRQVHQQQSESLRQHLEAVLHTQDLILMLAPGMQLSAGTLTLFKFCENCICKLCASGLNVAFCCLFQNTHTGTVFPYIIMWSMTTAISVSQMQAPLAHIGESHLIWGVF